MANENINDVKERVSALLRKASDSAATAAEAEAAMRLAQKLMKKFAVTEADLATASGDDFKEAVMAGRYHAKSNTYYLHPVQRYCAVVVGKFCGVTPYTSSDEEGHLCLKMFGFESDVELATWMLSSFVLQCENDWEAFKAYELGTRRLLTIKEARLTFTKKFADAVNDRLSKWLYREEYSPEQGTTSTGTDVALLGKKLATVEAELEKRVGRLGRGTHRGKSGNHGAAAAAGYAAGSRAETGRGVGGGRIAIGSN
jgi:Protein of unknown function (DUF2786)